MKPIVFIFFFFLCCSGAVAQDKSDKKQTAVAEGVVMPEMNVVNNKLTLKNAPVGKDVEIFTILGNKIKQIEVKSPDGDYALNLPGAIYIFKLDGVVKKFVIR